MICQENIHPCKTNRPDLYLCYLLILFSVELQKEPGILCCDILSDGSGVCSVDIGGVVGIRDVYLMELEFIFNV